MITEADEAEIEESSDGAEYDEGIPDIGVPHAPMSYGESSETGTAAPVDKPSESSGPYDIGVSRYMDEPSKTKPKPASSPTDVGAPGDSRGGIEPGAAPPRHYRPPPEQPQGAIAAEANTQVFVFEGTRAWDAWVAHKRATTGRPWTLTTSRAVNGRCGWFFPTLFPPKGADPPTSTLSAADQEHLQKHGI